MLAKHLVPSSLQAAAIAAAMAIVAPAQARPGGPGWQTPLVYNVPTGLTDVFLHIPCPTGYSVQNGGIIPLSAQTVTNGFLFTGNGPRLDETPAGYAEWAWKIEWNAGGAPAGSKLILNVLCKKGAP